MKPQTDARFLDSHGVAEIYGIPRNTLTQSRIDDTLYGVQAPAYRKIGNARNAKILYEVAVIEKWLGQFEEKTNTTPTPQEIRATG